MAATTSIETIASGREARPLAQTVSLVTGASRGIGAAIARELAAAGSLVVVDYATDEAGASAVLAQIRERGDAAHSVVCDVANHELVRETVAEIVSRFGRLDILVNNAGILRDRSFLKLTPGEWDDVMAVNLDGVMHTCSAALPHMVERGYGRIVNISSFVAQTGNFGQTNYAAAKAGMIGFTRALALEVARKGITVNAVCPGFIETGMWHSIPGDVRESILSRIPVRRVGSPEDVAKAVRYLVVDGAYVTGQTLNVNGGIYIG